MHRSVAPPCSFTILFDVPNKGDDYYYDDNPTDSSTYYSSSSSSCSSPVDCTLSLGTASTRQGAGARKSPQRATATTCMPSFRWDIFSQSSTKSASSGANRPSGSLSGAGGDPLLARRCANCDTTSTPLWRNGPRGPKSLCNACGIRYKKEERRAAATVAAAADPHKGGVGCHEAHPWGYAASSQRSSSMSSGGEFRFAHGYDSESIDDGTLPYLSWCLNVPQPRAEYLHHY